MMKIHVMIIMSLMAVLLTRPQSPLSSIAMETGEQGDKMGREHSCGRGSRRRGKRTEAEKKSKSNRSDLAGPDR